MLTWTVDSEIESRLEVLGAKTEDSKTALLRKAVLDLLEELEDVRMAEKVLENPGRLYTLGEVEQELGVGHRSDVYN
jgi:predicted transcriptional regulator